MRTRQLKKMMTLVALAIAFMAFAYTANAVPVEKLIIYENFGGKPGATVNGITPDVWPQVHADSGANTTINADGPGSWINDRNQKRVMNTDPWTKDGAYLMPAPANKKFNVDTLWAKADVYRVKLGALSDDVLRTDANGLRTKGSWYKRVPLYNGSTDANGRDSVNFRMLGTQCYPEFDPFLAYDPIIKDPSGLLRGAETSGYLYLSKMLGAQGVPSIILPSSDDPTAKLKDVSRVEMIFSGAGADKSYSQLYIKVEKWDESNNPLPGDTVTFGALYTPRKISFEVSGAKYYRITFEARVHANNNTVMNLKDFRTVATDLYTSWDGKSFNNGAAIPADGNNSILYVYSVKVYAKMEEVGYTATVGSGAIAGKTTGIAHGEDVTFTADATKPGDASKRFAGWKVSGRPDLSEVANPLTLNIKGNITVTPVYGGDLAEVAVVDENFRNWQQHGIAWNNNGGAMAAADNAAVVNGLMQHGGGNSGMKDTVTKWVMVPLKYGFKTPQGKDSIGIYLRACNVWPNSTIRVSNLTGADQWKGMVAFMGPNAKKGYVQVDSLSGLTKTVVALSNYENYETARAALMLVNNVPVVNKLLYQMTPEEVAIDMPSTGSAIFTVGYANYTSSEYTNNNPTNATQGGFTAGAQDDGNYIKNIATSGVIGMHSLKMYAQVTVPNPGVTSVTVDPATMTLSIGDIDTVRASVVVVGGASQEVAWTTSDAAIATVDAFGEVTAVADGTVKIAATSVADATKSDTCVVTVLGTPLVNSVTVTPATMTIGVGETTTLSADVDAKGGASDSVVWSTSDALIATVDSVGLVTGVAAGTVKVAATSYFDNTKSDTCFVTVVVPSVTSVTVSPKTASLAVNATQTLSAQVVVVGGASDSVLWSSVDALIATVDELGVVTAVAAGTVKVAATSYFDNTVSDTCEVTVLAPSVTSVTVNPKTASIKVGATKAIAASVVVVSGASQGVAWTSSDDLIATVDASGVVTAVAVGTAKIAATSTADATKSDTCVVTVTPAGGSAEQMRELTFKRLTTVPDPVTADTGAFGKGTEAPYFMVMYPSLDTIGGNHNAYGGNTLGATSCGGTTNGWHWSRNIDLYLKATGGRIDKMVVEYYPNAAAKDYISRLYVTSADKASFTANNAVSMDKYFFAHAQGAELKTLLAGDNYIYDGDSRSLTLIYNPGDVLQKPATGATTVQGTRNLRLTYSPVDTSAGNYAFPSTTTCITLTIEGLDVPKDSVLVLAQSNNSNGPKWASVKLYEFGAAEPSITSVTVSPKTATLGVTGTTTISAQVVAVGGASESVTWSTSNSAVATVDGAGLVTGLSAGTAKIAATSVDDATKSDTCVVTVSATPPSITSVTVSPKTASVEAGNTTTLTVNVVAVSGASEAVSWTSTNASVATVSAGVVTGVAAGTAKIAVTSTFDPTKSDTCVVTVTATPSVTSVTVTPSTATLTIDGTTTLEATVVVKHGAAQTVSWTSSNESAATVSSAGVVTAVGAGTATITATSTFDATKTGTCAVIVNKKTQTITWTQTFTGATYGDRIKLTATSNNSATPIVYTSSDASKALVKGDSLILVGASASNVTITASQVANDTYAAASATKSFAIAKASQTITWDQAFPAKVTVGDAPITLEATSSEGFDITYTSSNEAVATVSGSELTVVGAGTTTITATQPGNANYAAAVSVAKELTVETPTGVKSNNQVPVQVYPNPASTVVNLQFENDDTYSITLVDMAGQVAMKTTASGTSQSINVSRLVQGTYTVVIENSKKQRTVKLIMVGK